MAGEYGIWVYSPEGIAKAYISDYLDLAYTKVVNQAGLLKFGLRGDHSARQYLVNNAQVEVWRRDAETGIGWYADFYGLYKDPKRSYVDGKNLFTASCPGQLSMLNWRIVAWLAGQEGRSLFTSTPVETIMKNLVKYNATSLATTANGRERDGVISGITVEGDTGSGYLLDWGCPHENLLETLTKLSGIGENDFDLIKTGAQAWEFRFYAEYRGTDRRATVLFSLERGNMANPVYTKAQADEKTAAIVGGPGEELVRDISIATGRFYDPVYNNTEVFIDGRNDRTPALMIDHGESELGKSEALDILDFDVIQTPACLYGVHYELGDRVSAEYEEISTTPVIESVTVTFAPEGSETIAVELENVRR